MARFDVTGMQETIRDLIRMGEGVGPTADAMLDAAGSVMVQGWQFQAAKHGHIRTGAMYDSIKQSSPKTIKGVRQITVYPMGTDSYNRRKPVRNAEKGFVLNYGWSRRAGSHWAEEAEETSAEPAVDAMENVMDKFIQSIGGQQAGGAAAPWQSGGLTGGATFHQE